MNIEFVKGWNKLGNGEISTLALDLRTGELRVSQDTPHRTGDGTPMDEWHGIVRRYTADGETYEDGRTHADPNDLREYLEDDDTQALLNRIVAGSRVVWDGSNHVGRMTDDARAAESQFEAELLQVSRSKWVDWTCDEWFSQCMADIYRLDTVEQARQWGKDCREQFVLLDEDPADWCEREWIRHYQER